LLSSVKAISSPLVGFVNAGQVTSVEERKEKNKTHVGHKSKKVNLRLEPDK
jgi:hypothetical protein